MTYIAKSNLSVPPSISTHSFKLSKTTAALLTVGLVVSISSTLAGTITQNVTFETTGQSMWGTGESFSMQQDAFLGVQWNEQNKSLLSIGSVAGDSNGVAVSASTDGKLGLQTHFAMDSGTVNASLPFQFTFTTPDASSLIDQQAFNFGITQASLQSDVFLQTLSPTFQAYADLVLQANASITAKGCYDVWLSSGCGTTSASFGFDATTELIAINRDKDSEVRILDDFNYLFAQGSNVADLIDVDVKDDDKDKDDQDPNKRPEKLEVSLDIKPKVSIGNTDSLIEVDIHLPDIITENTGSTAQSSETGRDFDAILASGSDEFLKLDVDVDKLATDLGLLPPLSFGGGVDFGVGSVNANIDLLDVTFTPTMTLEQDFSMSITNMSVSYLFDDFLMAGLSGGALSEVSKLENLALDQQISMQWLDGQNIGITPTYNIDVNLSNSTGVSIDTSFSIDLLKGGVSAEVFGIDLGSSTFGPLATVNIGTGGIPTQSLFADTFQLAGFDTEQGNKILFSTDTLNFTGGTGFWNDENSWQDRDGNNSTPVFNNVKIEGSSENRSTVVVGVDASSGNVLIDENSSIRVFNSTLSIGGTEVNNNGAIKVFSQGKLLLGNTTISGDGLIDLSHSGVLSSSSGRSDVTLDNQTISASWANSHINDINLDLFNGSTINATGGDIEHNVRTKLFISNSNLTGFDNTVITTDSIGSIEFSNDSTITDIALDGNFKLADGSYLGWGNTTGTSRFNGQFDAGNDSFILLTSSQNDYNLVNNGDISLTSNARIMTFFGPNNLNLSGNGSIQLNGLNTSIYAPSVNNGRGHSINGSGYIEANTILNEGNISANRNAESLHVDTNSLINNGDLTANNGGQLMLNTDSGGFTNNGLVSANGNSRVIIKRDAASNLSSAYTLTGGQWQAIDGGQIDFKTSSDSGWFVNQADLTLQGNGSSINFLAQSGTTNSLDDFIFENGANGLITLNDGAGIFTQEFSNAGSVTLDNGALFGLTANTVTGLIQGNGEIRFVPQAPEFFNDGTIRAQGGDLIFSRVDNSNTQGEFIFYNSGTIEVMGGSSFKVDDNSTQWGRYQNKDTFGAGGVWAAYGETDLANILFVDTVLEPSPLGLGVNQLAETRLILSGQHANFITEIVEFDQANTFINLQESLRTIDANATLELRDEQAFTTQKQVSNAGNIVLADASLSGEGEGSVLNNTGAISGYGNLFTPTINNSGDITVIDGQLNVTGTVNNTNGIISVADQFGSVLNLQGANINSGMVNVNGVPDDDLAKTGILRGNGALNGVLLNNAGLIQSDSALLLDVLNGSTNSATIRASANSTLSLQGETLNNTEGLITAIENGEIKLQGLTVINGAMSVVGNGSVLSGYGNLENIDLAVSGGTITANVNGQVLSINPGQAARLFDASMRAENGGTLLLNNGSFEGAGGTLIQAMNGSEVQFHNVSVKGGRLTTQGNGKIVDIAHSNITNSTIAANLDIASGGEFNLYGTNINELVLTVQDGGEIVLHESRLTGLSAQSVTQPDGSVIVESVVKDGFVIIEAGGTLSGAGQFDNLSLTNNGTINANSSESLHFDLTGDLFVNDGNINVTGTGGMLINDSVVINNGALDIGSQSSMTVAQQYQQLNGTTVVNGELVAEQVTINGGSLSGEGTVIADVTIGEYGSVKPGNSSGSLILMGDLALNGTLYTEVLNHNDFDILNVSGELLLSDSSHFEFTLDSSFIPVENLFLDFLHADSIANFNLLDTSNFSLFGLVDGYDWWVQQNNNMRTLSLAFAMSNILPPTNVPEPKTLLLISLGFGILLVGRKRNSKKTSH